MRAFITGADGFVGQWLLRKLLRDGIYVMGMIRVAKPALTTLPSELAARVEWRQSELSDINCMRDLLRAARPEAVFHLAAQSSVPASNEDPRATFETNVLGTARLLEAVRDTAPDATVVVVGSSDAYGTVTPDQLPLDETAPLQPRNPYAASKAAAEIVALQYARTGWARTIVTRSFNHTGPGQSPAFAAASFAKQIAAMKNGRQKEVLRVGDLTPRRDITDVRDVVDAYVLLAQRGTVGAVYNVCSGRDYSMREIADTLARISGVPLVIREDPALLRPVENPVLRGDASRIAADTGWKATTPLETTLADLLDYYNHATA
ncbi:MAG TPA: GDP-mannose 4,6-dehydratase [Candidatus Eremiobacteraceae bacterium]|nr:GDP-mannose 4,6-dehydratase [Candidatus Eremiobacteraceae bacterium]